MMALFQGCGEIFPGERLIPKSLERKGSTAVFVVRPPTVPELPQNRGDALLGRIVTNELRIDMARGTEKVVKFPGPTATWVSRDSENDPFGDPNRRG